MVQSNPKIGGPKDIDMLFSKEELLEDLQQYEIEILEETQIQIEDRMYHSGSGSVIRFVGKKSF